jgi:hypothetical protein
VKRKAIPLAVLIVSIALLFAASPVLGAPPHGTTVSGLECVYVVDPGQMEITEHWMRVTGQVNLNQFYSDDPDLFPNGTNYAVIDWTLNFHSGMVVWTGKSAVFEPDGFDGAFVGTGGGWFKMGGELMDSKGNGVFHGTGELEGLTLKQKLYAGDITQCPEGAFDATVWVGFLVPPDP